MFRMSEQIGAAVRRARAARGLSLRALAARLALSPATLSAVENGKVAITVDRLTAIAEALDTPVEQLLRGRPAEADDAAATPTSPAAGAWREFAPLDLDPAQAAALRLFVRRGFAATTMREIAAEAGLSVAGVYHHHASKQALLESALDQTMAELHWRIRAARDDGASPAERFALMVEALALYHAHRPDLAFLGASEMRSFEGATLDRMRASRNELQHLIDEQAELAVAAGEFSNPQPRPALRAISTMCTSLPQWFRPTGELSTAQIAREFARLALGMMGDTRSA